MPTSLSGNEFYQQLEGLQGERGTYLAGSIMNFELVGNHAVYARHPVPRLF